MQRFLSLGEGEPQDVIQKLRPVLEGYCQYLYPTLFGDQDTLGVIVCAIRAATAHPLQAIADDLDEVNTYCRRYHHAENPDAATEPIDDAELQEYVRRLCQVNSPRGTIPGCTFDDPATFGIAFRLKSSATPSGCITDTA